MSMIIVKNKSEKTESRREKLDELIAERNKTIDEIAKIQNKIKQIKDHAEVLEIILEQDRRAIKKVERTEQNHLLDDLDDGMTLEDGSSEEEYQFVIDGMNLEDESSEEEHQFVIDDSNLYPYGGSISSQIGTVLSAGQLAIYSIQLRKKEKDLNKKLEKLNGEILKLSKKLRIDPNNLEEQAKS